MNPASARLQLSFTCCLLLTAATACRGELVNLSSRAFSDRGADAIVAGFVIVGDSANKTLIRAAGPALESLGVANALKEARLELRGSGVIYASNSAWDRGGNAAAVAEASRQVGAFDFQANSRDAALLVNLAPGVYTAVVTPAGDVAPGVALVEVYDVEPGNAGRLGNLSIRARAGSGSETLITGFVVVGPNNRVLVRGVGPGLRPFGVSGVLNDPTIEILAGNRFRAHSGNWGDEVDAFEIASRANAVGAFPLDESELDAATLIRPDPGVYSAQARGADGGSGLALVEVYDVHALTPMPPAAAFDLVGFGRVNAAGQNGITGGGERLGDYNPVAGTGNYWRIDDTTLATPNFGALFRAALVSDEPLIVEINTTIDLSIVGDPDMNSNRIAISHPDLIAPGAQSGFVGVIELGSNKTIYSGDGSGMIKRGAIFIVGKQNIMIRNLRFRELWEWDDATEGDYDRNDWDYINITSAISGGVLTARAHHIWIDHCDFANSYDGQVDIIRGSDLITVSWCRFGGGYADDAAAWIDRQMAYLAENAFRFPYYSALRARIGIPQVVAHSRAERKSSLVGNSASSGVAALDKGHLNVTYHHNWYHGVDQRMPRMRFGNAHIFNLCADGTPYRGVTGLSSEGVLATSRAAIKIENSQFVDVNMPVDNDIFGENDGVVAVEGSINWDRAGGRDKGFDFRKLIEPALFRWNTMSGETSLVNWPEAESADLPSGYFPLGHVRTDYIDPVDFMKTHLEEAGVIVPGHFADEVRLRRWLQTSTPSALP